MKRIRVGIDGRRHDFDGIGRTTSLIVEALARNPAMDVIVFGDPTANGLLAIPQNAQYVKFDQGIISEHAFESFASTVGKSNVDVFIGPQWFSFLEMPCPTIVFLHDAAPFDGSAQIPSYEDFQSSFGTRAIDCLLGNLGSHTPSHWQPTDDGSMERLYQSMYRAVAARSTRIVTVSQTSRTALVQALPEVREKISVLHLFVSDSLTSPTQSTAITLSERFLLCVGKWEPRKRQSELIDTFEVALEDTPELHLILAGDRFHFYRSYSDRLEERVLHHQAKGRISWLPKVSDTALSQLYTAAVATILNSHFEGFGLPAVEAMHSGSAVISSGGGALTEICGGADLRVGFSQTQLASAIEDMWHNKTIRNEYQDLSRRRAQFFSQSRFSAGLSRIIEDVVAENNDQSSLLI